MYSEQTSSEQTFYARSAMEAAFSARIFPALDGSAPLHTGDAPKAAIQEPTATQRSVVDSVQQHLFSTVGGVDQPQLLLLVRGASGSGKSTLARALAKMFTSLGHRDCLAVTATSPTTACIAPRELCRLHTVSAATYLIIDHASLLSAGQLFRIACQISQIRNATKSKKSTLLFGGLNVIVLTDVQLRSPKGERNAGVAIGETVINTTGEPLASFTLTFTLEGLPESRHDDWGKLLERLESGGSTPEDDEILEKRVVTSSQCFLPDFHSEPWASAPLLTYRNEVAILWNNAALRKFAARTGQTIATISARDRIGRRALTSGERAAVRRLALKKTARLASELPVCVGMPILALVDDGIALGTVIQVLSVGEEGDLPGYGNNQIFLAASPGWRCEQC
ncbi:hypothetical protein B0H15DRAFT_956866 [Mycena belliarum]|uniref:Uncharacterized protein n=1 Tax=Mycena belliarum TaxID=1033014 RepID=A0AAD6XJ07_9AGAR|nr:hypothetical protein B0H15DRAFT_956866 [Mycena belliae]